MRRFRSSCEAWGGRPEGTGVPRIVQWHRFPAVALFVPHGAERDDILAAVLAQLDEVGAAIAPIGVAPNAEPTAQPPDEP